MGEWVRFKLDQRTDHVLVDEAQDTNADQWQIIDALVEEFFSGSSRERRALADLVHGRRFQAGDLRLPGHRPARIRGLPPFGHRPRHRAGRGRRRRGVRVGARSARAIPRPVDQRQLPLVARGARRRRRGDRRSSATPRWGWRSRPIAHAPRAPTAPARSNCGRRSCRPVPTRKATAARKAGSAQPLRAYADAPRPRSPRLARRGARPCHHRPPDRARRHPDPRPQPQRARLADRRATVRAGRAGGRDRPAAPRQAAGGQGLLAAIALRGPAQDDLNLACLLVSPLVGWDQQQLLDLAMIGGRDRCGALLQREQGERDFARPRCCRPARHGRQCHPGALPRDDAVGHASGTAQAARAARRGGARPDRGTGVERARFRAAGKPVARPLPRLVRAAARSRSSATPSAPSNAVRVMTVHGAKGLEAPRRASSPTRPTTPPGSGGPRSLMDGRASAARRRCPLIRPRASERIFPFAELIDAQKARDLEEHWRLLYVALTRAAERLVIAGVQPRSDLSDQSWHATVDAPRAGGLAAPCLSESGRRGGARLAARAVAPRPPRRSVARFPPRHCPPGRRRAAPEEERPPRPLAPSALGDDRDAAAAAIARRSAPRRGAARCSMRCSNACRALRRPSAARPALRWLDRRQVDDRRARHRRRRAARDRRSRLRRPVRRRCAGRGADRRDPARRHASSPAPSIGC